MLISTFDFQLPEELIAQTASEKRDGSRMLVLDRERSSFEDDSFVHLPERLKSGDLLVVNNTKVFPARLSGTTETGAHVEIFLVSEHSTGSWIALAKPAKRLPIGKAVTFSTEFSCEVLDKLDDGKVVVKFCSNGNVFEAIEKHGRTPLPPYIKRDHNIVDEDRERYQTIYASDRGAIAAPTAGLHFTPATFEQLGQKGIEIAEIALHVGYGTFEPVRVEDLAEHRVSPEVYEITERAASKLNLAKKERRRIIAVGTTTTRALENEFISKRRFDAGRRTADLTITPGYEFGAIDGLLTNFHLPKSSLLVLTSTFGGRDLVMSGYQHAVAEQYRFYSYGDCMLIL